MTPSQSDELTKLKRQRGVIKAACTRIRNYFDASVPRTPDIVFKIQERFSKLEGYWSEYNTVQSEIQGIDPAECDDRIQFENAFYALSADMRAIINMAIGPPVSRGSASPVSDFANVNQISNVRLPKLNLPTFSGKYEGWFSFHDIFSKTIGGNPSITDSQRFQYLKTSLAGEASDIIDALEITDQNNPVAWELLGEHYDNLRLTVNAHLTTIFDLPSMVKENSHELRQIADGAAKHVRALKALKCPADSWDDILIYILTSKLDNVTRPAWQTSRETAAMPTLAQFLKFLNHKGGSLETSGKIPFLRIKLFNVTRQASRSMPLMSRR